MDQKTGKLAQGDKIELRPDGWQRFDQAVDIASKAPAIRSTSSPPKTPSVVKDKGKP